MSVDLRVDGYDPIANPYAPGAGTPPPALVGRESIVEAAEALKNTSPAHYVDDDIELTEVLEAQVGEVPDTGDEPGFVEMAKAETDFYTQQ
mgnify:CR=1 FL=1